MSKAEVEEFMSKAKAAQPNILERNLPLLGPFVKGARLAVQNPADFARTVDDLGRSVAEGVTFGFADEIAARGDELIGLGNYEENLAKQQARDEQIDPVLRLGGNVGGTALSMAAAPAVGLAKGAAGVGKTIATGLGLGSLAGAGYSKPGERLEGAATGAVLGAGIPAALHGGAKIVSPAVRAGVQKVRELGVSPTVGQLFPKTVGRVEQGLQSIPLVGSVVRNARRRAVEQFNTGAINHALSPAGIKLPAGTKVGREAIAAGQDALDDAYSRLLKPVKNIMPDRPFLDAMGKMLRDAKQELSDDGFRILTGRVKRFMKGNEKTLTGESLNALRSQLNTEAKKFGRSALISERDIGAKLANMREAVDDLLSRNLSPEGAVHLRGVRRGYAQFARIEEAAKRGAEGVFTPAQLKAASKALDDSVRKRRFARGEAMLQDIAESGQEVLGDTLPDSGTPERLTTLAALAGGAAYVDPLIGGTTAAGLSLYTKPVQNVLARLATSRQGPAPRAVANFLRDLALPAGAAGAVTASRL
jgi:hypothetical protein